MKPISMMPRRYASILLTFISLLSATISQSQTSLAQGELSIIGFNINNSAGIRSMSFVCWVDVAPLTVIKFTDCGFLTGAASTATNNARWVEQLATWTATSLVTAGTVITINDDAVANLGTVTVGNTTGGTGLAWSLAVAGDEIFAFQSSASIPGTNPSTFSGTILFGLGFRGTSSTFLNWVTTGAVTTYTSYRPMDLLAANTIFLNIASITGGQYNGVRTGQSSLAAYKTLVNNPGSWTTVAGASTSPAYTTTAFTAGTAAPVITADPAAASACTNSNTGFSITATGAASYQWQVNPGSGFTNIANAGAYTGANTNTLTITGAAVSMSGYSYQCIATSSSALSTTSGAATLSVSDIQLASASQTITQNVSSNNFYNSSACNNLIANVQPAGASPVSGNVTARVWVEGSVPAVGAQPYVARHYEITPAVNAASASGRVTLYFTQQEFTDYNNSAGSVLNLPTGSGDASGKGNLRVAKYTGTSSNGSGLPSTYSGSSMIIDPADADIVWNGGNARWEVSFTVTGFSGFIIQTSTFILPLKILSFSGDIKDNKPFLTWKTTDEFNTATFEIEKSMDGRNFLKAGTIAAFNTPGIHNYQFTDLQADPNISAMYYRLKQTDMDGRSAFSSVIPLRETGTYNRAFLYANPVTDGKAYCIVRLHKATNVQMNIYTNDGKLVKRQTSLLNSGTNSVLIDINTLMPGVYFIHLTGGAVNEQIKLIKGK